MAIAKIDSIAYYTNEYTWSSEPYVIHPKCEKTDQNRYGRKAHVGARSTHQIKSSQNLQRVIGC
jgi:hypothetical protein